MTVAGYVHGIGGMQDHTVDLVQGLAAAGHEVDVICPGHPDGVEHAEHKGGTWHFVDARTRRTHLPMRHPEWFRLSADAFAALNEHRRFDLVHSESTSALGLLHEGWQTRIPLVVKFHGNYLTFARAAGQRLRGRYDVVRDLKGLAWTTGEHFLTRGNWYAFRRCEAMVPSHAQLRDTARSHLLPSTRVHVVPNGIDADVFSPGDQDRARAELGLAPGLVFVWLGRMYPGKGASLALRALARTDMAVKLLLVGDGESRASLESLARRTGVSRRVVFAGRQPRDRVPLYLRSADALVFPTRLPEAAPLTPLQGMACGLPVLASRLGAVPELVDRPGRNGLLVAPGDVSALAAGMSALARDQALRARMGTAARARVLAEYTLELMIERTVEVYSVARDRFDRGQ